MAKKKRHTYTGYMNIIMIASRLSPTFMLTGSIGSVVRPKFSKKILYITADIGWKSPKTRPTVVGGCKVLGQLAW